MRGDLLCRFESVKFEWANPTRYCHMLTRRGEVKNENSGQNDPYRYLSPRNSTKTRNLHGHIKNHRICAAESVHLFLRLQRNSRSTVRNNIKVHTHFCIEFLRWKIQRDQTVTPTGFLLHWTSDRMGFQVQRANLYILLERLHPSGISVVGHSKHQRGGKGPSAHRRPKSNYKIPDDEASRSVQLQQFANSW